MSTETEKAELLRRKISAMIENISDRGSLRFAYWLLKRITENEPVPPTTELRKLRRAFVRLDEALRDRSKDIDLADLQLMAKYVSTGEVKIGRPLANAIKFYRAEKKLTRVELSRRSGISLRTILSMERGRFDDISIPRFAILAQGLSVDPLKFMGKVMEFLKVSREQKAS